MPLKCEWAARRGRSIHMTIRDVDCKEFDITALIDDFKRMHVTFFSFHACGYVTNYPSKLDWQRQCPELNGRDLCGEIIDAAHAAGMKAIPLIDLGEVPIAAAEAHPNWAAQHEDGSFFVKSDGIVTSCPLGDYVRQCSREVVAELEERYELDGMKFGGASYGFAPGVCHCPTCQKQYPADTGRTLPAERDQNYRLWCEKKMKETVRYLVDLVHDIAGVPVIGNSVWHLGGNMDIEDLARDQDLVQLEVQNRIYPTPDDSGVMWAPLRFPNETTRYVTHVSQNPPIVVASYFVAWPWRRVAVPPAEQKVYLAQVAANGGTPMVNLSGGPPAVHHDKRGFKALEELYGFMAANEELYEGDRSGATVAVVFNYETAVWAKKQPNAHERYLAELHACEDALDRAHIPYDIVSTAMLQDVEPGRYAAILLPGAYALDEQGEVEIHRLADAGTGLVVTGAPGSVTIDGEERDGIRLADLLGVTAVGPEQNLTRSPHAGPCQAYMRLVGTHAITHGIDCELMAVSGTWHRVEAAIGVDVPVHRAASFRVFPEGMSYADYDDPAEPLVLARDRVVYMPFSAGRCAARVGHPDNERLLANAVRFAAGNRIPIRIEGHKGLLVSVREQDERTLVHCINLTTSHRFFDEATPLHEVAIEVQSTRPISKVYLAGSKKELDFDSQENVVRVTVPKIVDYDIVVFERDS